MSVVIVGGNECMVRQYKELCQEYSCCAKVFTEIKGGLKNKMVRCALSETKGLDTVIARSHSSSMSALKNILREHAV